MDLSEYYALYHQTIEAQLVRLESLCAQLRDAPENRALLTSTLRAAHIIKGASWTIRETPALLNSDLPDTRYDHVAKLAEQIEAHLENVLNGKHELDDMLLCDRVNLLEAAFLQSHS